MRIAASTWVESVRWRPRALSHWRSRQRSSRVSSSCCSAPPVTRRVRNSLTTDASKPASVNSKPKAYFQSMRPRTAVAACRSDKPLRILQDRHEGQPPGGFSGTPAGGEQGGEGLVGEEHPNLIPHAHIDIPLGKGGACHSCRVAGDATKVSGVLRVPGHESSPGLDWGRAGHLSSRSDLLCHLHCPCRLRRASGGLLLDSHLPAVSRLGGGRVMKRDVSFCHGSEWT